MIVKKRGRPKKSNTVKRVSAKDVLIQLEKHEARCAVELREINRRLDEGSKRFIRLEQYIWGLYAAIFVSAIAGKLL
tara:strand:- start:149 stop:379 length:231 start_codon:yes stop_codon:yes gene_type:complete